jgi:hypothetical protein
VRTGPVPDGEPDEEPLDDRPETAEDVVLVAEDTALVTAFVTVATGGGAEAGTVGVGGGVGVGDGVGGG